MKEDEQALDALKRFGEPDDPLGCMSGRITKQMLLKAMNSMKFSNHRHRIKPLLLPKDMLEDLNKWGGYEETNSK